MALIRLCNFGKSYWLMLCTSQRCWHWSISWLILTWWAIYWQADKPLNWGGNEAGVLQHSAPSLTFFHSNNDLCCAKRRRKRLMASRVDLSQATPTVLHHANRSLTVSIVLPYYEPYLHLNTFMLTVICLVTICTLELFVLTLILAR